MSSITLDPSQERAVHVMCTAPFAAISGGPGTGKTSCLKFALDRFDADGTKFELCSPTGKAARRMYETTGREARTIHRLLAFKPGAGFQHDAGNPLDTDVVVVDESSMIDVELGAALFAAVDAERTRVILIGDANQLPPVGPGRIFGDLVDSGAVPVARLQHVHRSAAESWICQNAPRVLAGEQPDLERRHDFRFVEVESVANILPAVRQLVTDVMPREINADAQLLIPQRTGAAGIDWANAILQDALNPRRGGAHYIPRDKHELRVGDRVIQTRNDYKLAVFNGEVGNIEDIAEGQVVVHFEGRGPVEYTLDQANGLQLAYALTVHRSQGSEFPWVICVVHSTHSFMLTRQLVYTAITRGKQGVILVGDRKGLRTALSDRKPPRRNTALIERLRGELPANGQDLEAG